MDYNEDRWGSRSRNRDTPDEGGKITKDFLENSIGDFSTRDISSRVYFQNIGTYNAYCSK